MPILMEGAPARGSVIKSSEDIPYIGEIGIILSLFVYLGLTLIFFQVFDYSILFLSILPVTLASAWTGSKFGTITALGLVIYNIFILSITGNIEMIFEITFIGWSAVMILLAWMVGKIKDVNTQLNKELKKRKKIEKKLSGSKKRIEKLHVIAKELEISRKKDEIYKLTIRASKEILDFDICCILVVHEDKLVVEQSSYPASSSGEEWIPLHDSIAGKTYLNKESYLIENIDDHEYSPSKPTENTEEYNSFISIPLGDEGVFQACGKEAGSIKGRDVEVLELLCDHATEALKRLKMIEREEFLHSLLRHDVRNKINIVKRYLSVVLEYDLPEKPKEHLQKANRVIQKSDDLIEKIKTLSKVEEEKIIEINVSKAIRSAIEKNKGLASEKGVEIETDLSGSKVKAGPLLEELFANLIENSLKHSGGDLVKVSVEESRYKSNVIIEDDGKGIPSQEREKIFEKGYKKGENAGSGLGMYMVNKIAKNYGAKVLIDDSKLGGALFEVPLEKVDN